MSTLFCHTELFSQRAFPRDEQIVRFHIKEVIRATNGDSSKTLYSEEGKVLSETYSGEMYLHVITYNYKKISAWREIIFKTSDYQEFYENDAFAETISDTIEILRDTLAHTVQILSKDEIQLDKYRKLEWHDSLLIDTTIVYVNNSTYNDLPIKYCSTFIHTTVYRNNQEQVLLKSSRECYRACNEDCDETNYSYDNLLLSETFKKIQDRGHRRNGFDYYEHTKYQYDSFQQLKKKVWIRSGGGNIYSKDVTILEYYPNGLTRSEEVEYYNFNGEDFILKESITCFFEYNFY